MKITNIYCLLSDLTQAQIDMLVKLMPESSWLDFNPCEIWEVVIGFTENGKAGTFIQRADDKIITYKEMLVLLGANEEGKSTTESIIDMIRSRAAVGLDKYGVSVDRTDLTTDQWIQHAIEEMLDGAQYLYRIKQELAKRTK